MSFSLVTDDAVLTWDEGKLTGAPLTAVGDAQAALDTRPHIDATPTGPWFERGTPEHAYLVLRALAPEAEVVGDPPEFEDYGPELPSEEGPDALQEAEQFDPHLHPRGRAGRFIRVHFKAKGVEPVILGNPHLDLNDIWGTLADEKGNWIVRSGFASRASYHPDDVKKIEELQPDYGKGEDAPLVPREALTGQLAHEHLNLLFLAPARGKPWVGRLTDGEKNALNVYRSPEGYQLINDALRGKEGASLDEKKGTLYKPEGEPRTLDLRSVDDWVKLIDSAIGKAPATGVPLDMWMYRGIRDAVAVFGSDNPKPGTRISDPAYTSTTTNLDVARNFATQRPWWLGPEEPLPAPALVEVSIPAGARGAWMAGAFGLDELASEFVLPRGSAFEVTDVRDELGAKVGEKLRVIEVKLVTDPRAVVEGLLTLDLLEADFDPALHPRDRRGRFIRFLHSMPPNSIERMAHLNIVRNPGGDYTIEPDVGATTHHPTPESVWDRMQEVNQAHDERERHLNPTVLDPYTFRGVFDGFEHGGLRARVDSVSGGLVQGTILDGETYAGSFAREAFQSDGETVVYHDKLKLLPEYQGRGFGTAFFEHSLEKYQALDVNKVTVTAADMVGGYQWARAGFDFDTGRANILAYGVVHRYREAHPDAQIRDVSNDEKFARAWAAYDIYYLRYWQQTFYAERPYSGVPQDQWDEFERRFPKLDQLHAYLTGDDHALDGTFTTPQEIATFGRDQHRWTETHDTFSNGKEMWLGKRLMLGAAWRGEIRLR
jgi:GNAT superfamily N-acetyltransferase